MTTTTKSRRLSENDRLLLENLGKFCVHARHSSWENLTHTNDVEAVNLIHQMSPVLTGLEYRGLMAGWSDIRLHGNEAELNQTVEMITNRLQNKAESF